FTAKKVQLSDLSIVVSQESDKIYNSIKAFVDKYNEVIDAVNTKISQVKYKDFAPLTDAQKKELSEDDIKLWEDKAKSGLLRNDAILSSSLQTFRNALTKSVSGLPVSNLKSLSELGITTGSYTEKGKLLINETKLRAAISDKPGEVMALFTSTDSVALTDAGDGIATRLYDYSNRMIDVLKNKAGSTTGIEASNLIHKQVIQLNKQMDTFNLKLTTLESRYYRQFTAMEKYITQLSSQSNFLANNYSQQ
ncbi:MAG TPA: flagellar filament capping protein FliD, partial [Bacilli bacterium]